MKSRTTPSSRRCSSAGSSSSRADDQRRAADNLQLTIHPAGQPFERAHIVLGVRLRHPLVQALEPLWPQFLSPALADPRHIQHGVPDREVAHGGELAHGAPIFLHRPQHA